MNIKALSAEFTGMIALVFVGVGAIAVITSTGVLAGYVYSSTLLENQS